MTHDRAQIRKEIERVLMRIAPEADMATLDPAEPIRDQLDIDSFDFLRFIIGLHEAVGAEVPESDYPHLLTMDSAVDYVSTSGPRFPGEDKAPVKGATS